MKQREKKGGRKQVEGREKEGETKANGRRGEKEGEEEEKERK